MQNLGASHSWYSCFRVIIKSQEAAQTCWLSHHFYFVNCDRKEIYFLTIFSINVCLKNVTRICPRMLENMAKRVSIFIFHGDSMLLDLPRTCKTHCLHNLTQLSLLVFNSDHIYFLKTSLHFLFPTVSLKMFSFSSFFQYLMTDVMFSILYGYKVRL